MSKKVKLGMVTLSSVAVLASCGSNANGDSLGTTPVTPESTEEVNTVVESNQEEQAVQSNEESTQETTEEQTNTEQPEEVTETSNDTTNETTAQTSNQDSPGIEYLEFPITVYDAIDLFNNEFGRPHIDEIEFEREDGRYVYDFEGWDGQYEYELKIDAQTGEILSREVEAEDDQGDILDLSGIITPQEAMAIALEVSGGSYVKDWELEVEDGYTVYDIDIEGGEDQDIDAHTGDVR
jgi:uncharacterized membrane protein YkoI